MDKYIIDGVEYSYGEEVEVRNDGYWCKRIFVGYIKNAIEPIICVSDTFEKAKLKKKIPLNTSFSGLLIDSATEYLEQLLDIK